MSLQMNLKFAALLGDEVRHYRPKFDICRKVFFWRPCPVKIKFSLHLSIELNFRHNSKKIKGGSPKKILEKKNVFPKKYVELRTFDGNSLFIANRNIYMKSRHGFPQGMCYMSVHT